MGRTKMPCAPSAFSFPINFPKTFLIYYRMYTAPFLRLQVA